MALVGTLSSRAEGDAAWQPTRVAQSREFAGAIDVRADASPIKLKLGAHTLLLKGRTELSVALEEGGTRVRLARGEAIFDVSGAFSVQTANAMISVTGTRFLVSGDADETEVVVQRGGVELAAAEKSVKLGPSERSVAAAGKAPSAPARADLAKRLQWARALEETLTIEAELMALQKGMSVIADAGASGGRGIGVKGPVAAGTEATAEARVQVKQPVPYSVWMRIQWNHGVAPAFTLQVHEHPKASPHGVAAKPGWQWVRAGSYDVPADGFRLRVADGQGGVRIDRLVVTSDPEYVPE
jgi:ferric-dicitrate binding protein FerR (iron transport regulator)